MRVLGQQSTVSARVLASLAAAQLLALPFAGVLHAGEALLRSAAPVQWAIQCCAFSLLNPALHRVSSPAGTAVAQVAAHPQPVLPEIAQAKPNPESSNLGPNEVTLPC